MGATKEALRAKKAVIDAMCATAEKNGKQVDWFDMESLANRLHRLETTLGRLAEEECSKPYYDMDKQERLEDLAEKLIWEKIGCKCYTQRDPRGFCIRMYLVREDGLPFFNSWDGETTALAWQKEE